MTCRDVDAAGHVYRFCPEDPVPDADRLRAIVRGRFVDELTGRELTADLSVTTETAGLSPRAAAGGIAGLIGNPLRTFPGLSGGPVDLILTVSASRYLPRRFEETLVVPGFPNNFQPLDLGTVMMHRQAVVLRGRVVRANTVPRSPVAGATVSIDGIWRTFPAANVDPLTVVEAPDLVAMRPGLYRQRDAVTSIVRRRDMVLAVGQEKTLTRPVVAGEATIEISDALNLNPGDILAVEPNHPDRVEHIGITSIDPAGTPDQPARVVLNHPLAHDHMETAETVRATPQPAGLDNIVTRNGIPGDRSVFLNTLNDLSAATVVEIVGTGDPEYQTMALYRVLSDADGYFRLPPLHRVAQLVLHAERADLPQPVDHLLSPDYDHFEDRRDLVLA